MSLITDQSIITIALIILLVVLVAVAVYNFLPDFLKTGFQQQIAGALFPGGYG